MKKLFLVLSLAAISLSAMAVPAKRGVWKTLTLSNGTEVKAQLVGDEHGHFWRSADGVAYAEISETDLYQEVDARTIVSKAHLRRTAINAKRAKRLAKKSVSRVASFEGVKKGLIILVNFSDTKFKTAHNNAYFTRMANEENFSDGNFKGSMSDYFKAQSLGKFELDFDVVGPVTVAQNSSYYGQNDSEGTDKRAGEMVIEAVNLAKKQVTNWSQYDWDNDGEIDQVYVVYAGKGEADGGSNNTIWPHAYDLTSAQQYGDGSGPVKVTTGLEVNTYACGSELNGGGSICGIGTMCHEFSHCLGYPDFYDTDYSGGQGMGVWDLMDSGSYNDNGYQPAGYTSYERWVAGWTEPVILDAEDVKVENMNSLQSSGESYIIYNKRNKNEYFLLENRQLDRWDKSLPSSGLLIIHVDYNANAWEMNEPNDDPSHQRMTWMPADNKYQYELSEGTKYYTEEGMANDPFPYGKNNAFNKDTKPAAKLYNKNSDNTYYLSSSVSNITQNQDGTVSFNFIANYSGGSVTPGDEEEPTVKPTIEGAVFYESFNSCDGKGGNDGQWGGQIANAEFLTDNTGWSAEKAYGASQCAKFGTGSIAGKATTPAFELNGEGVLSFKVGAWNTDKDGMTLKLSATGATVTPATVTMSKAEFTDFVATVIGHGNVRITFESEKGRFFLDEVIVSPKTTSGIKDIMTNSAKTKHIYTLDGRYVGSDFGTLGRGLYIINGKKVVK